MLNPDGEGVDKEGVATEGADAKAELFHEGKGFLKTVGIGGGEGDGFGCEELLLGDGCVLKGVHTFFVEDAFVGGAGFHEGEAFVGFEDDVGTAELSDDSAPAPGGLWFLFGWKGLRGR